MMHENLRQLVYVSRALRLFTAEDLITLARQSEQRNRESDVAGALLYGRGLFLQALEGEHDAVDEVRSRIHRDPRHSNVQTLVDHTVKGRAFQRWAMTPVVLDDQLTWTDEHLAAVQRMASVATVIPPGLAAHTLIGSFTKHITRLAA